MKNVLIVFIVIIVVVIGVVAYMQMKPGDNGGPSESGSVDTDKGEVVIYVAQDRDYAEVVMKEFEEETGIKVNARYDTEADKTVGHVRRLRAEKDNPKCDVHWNNEPMHSVALAQEGIYAPYVSKHDSKFPEEFKDSADMWIGFAARARVIIYNTEDDAPEFNGMMDFTKEEFKGKTCIANPRAGSTQTHMAALHSAWGEEKFLKWVMDIKANDVKILASNGQTANAVANGELWYGLTDTDDAVSRREERNKPCDLLFPDQDGEGAVMFPNTLALVKGGPNADNGKILIDWLLMKELHFAKSPAAQIPLNTEVETPEGRYAISDFKAMELDWADVAAARDAAMKILNENLPLQ
ncbi:MAG: extracellular solute-binding protein [Planctomycetota bacterium]|nr:extracellular solute-binding protein [Planctomycetota bacterium]